MILTIKEANCPDEHTSIFRIWNNYDLDDKKDKRSCHTSSSPVDTSDTKAFGEINFFPSEISAILMFNFYELKKKLILFPILFFIVVIV